MPTHEHDHDTTSRSDRGEAELRREIDSLQRRVAELEAAASSQADVALARQDALLQAILRNLPFDFWVRDLHEIIIMQSDASVRLWGDLSATRVDDADVPEEIRSVWRSINERVFAGETLQGEKEYLLPSGEKRIFRDIVAPIRMGEEILGILGTNIDITEQVNSLRLLHESEALLNMTQRLSRMGGWQWDVEQQTTTWTRELYRLHGLSPDQFEPGSPEPIQTSLACYEPGDREILGRAFETCATLGVPYDLELTFTPFGGEPMRVRTSAEALWVNGRVSKVLGTFQDVTEKRILEQRYESLFQHMLDGFALHEIICDDGGRPVDYRFLEVNPAFERHTGLSAGDIKGRTVREVLPMIEQVWIDTYGKVALTGAPVLFEEYTAAQDKFFQVCAFRPAPMQFACIFTDISHRKRYERDLCQAKEAAEAANVAKSEFLANMSHEIRTPLNGIMGILQVFESQSLSTEQQKLIDLATTSAGRLSGLLSDILDLARIESGKLSFAPAPFDPRDLRSSTLGLFETVAKERNLNLEFILDSSLPPMLMGDESRLRQVLFNLVGNALKFTETGFVRVEIAPLRGFVHPRILFCVTDSGPGISDHHLKDVFSPFVQGEGSYVRRHQGAGLGLAIVKRIVGLLDGGLCVDSGKGGTSICFSVPMSATGAIQPDCRGQADSTDATGTAPRELRILLVEDDAVSMFAARRVLEKAGHSVTAAEDGGEVLPLLREHDFDLILMDVQLPFMDGLQATAAIRSDTSLGQKSRIPIVAMTAYAMGGDREKFLAAGMNDYIAKPVGAGELLGLLRRLAISPAEKP